MIYICISLIASEVKHLFICVIASQLLFLEIFCLIPIYFLLKCLFIFIDLKYICTYSVYYCVFGICWMFFPSLSFVFCFYVWHILLQSLKISFVVKPVNIFLYGFRVQCNSQNIHWLYFCQNFFLFLEIIDQFSHFPVFYSFEFFSECGCSCIPKVLIRRVIIVAFLNNL